MRLIDADKLKKCYEGHNGIDDKADYLSIRRTIDSQPTAYDVDKVVERLEKIQYKAVSVKNEDISIYATGMMGKAIEIVKQGGVSDDVCEWHKVKNGNAYKCNTHEEIHDTRVLDWCRCPYCGKKIKVVE